MSKIWGCSQMWLFVRYWQCPALSQDILSPEYFVAATIYPRIYYLSLNGRIHLAREYPMTPVRTCWVIECTCIWESLSSPWSMRIIEKVHYLCTSNSNVKWQKTMFMAYCIYHIFPQIKDWSTIFSSPLTPGLVFRHGLLFFKPFATE